MFKYFKFITVFLLGSCSLVEDYRYIGEETVSGIIESEFYLHEHFKAEDSSHQCYYYHDTIIENYTLTIEKFKKVKRLKPKQR